MCEGYGYLQILIIPQIPAILPMEAQCRANICDPPPPLPNGQPHRDETVEQLRQLEGAGVEGAIHRWFSKKGGALDAGWIWGLAW